jgi:hypothetical protein
MGQGRSSWQRVTALFKRRRAPIFNDAWVVLRKGEGRLNPESKIRIRENDFSITT